MLTEGGPVDRAFASKMQDAWALIRQQVRRARISHLTLFVFILFTWCHFHATKNGLTKHCVRLYLTSRTIDMEDVTLGNALQLSDRRICSALPRRLYFVFHQIRRGTAAVDVTKVTLRKLRRRGGQELAMGHSTLNISSKCGMCIGVCLRPRPRAKFYHEVMSECQNHSSTTSARGFIDISSKLCPWPSKVCKSSSIGGGGTFRLVQGRYGED